MMDARLVTEAPVLKRYRYSRGQRGVHEDESGAFVAWNDVKALLDQINMLACYASEEDTSSQPAALLEIGKLARGESTPFTRSATTTGE